MTAATSSETTKKAKRTSYFGKRYLNDIGSNKKGLIVNCVMQLLGLPVISVIALIMCYVNNNYDRLKQETIIALENGTLAFMIIAIVALGISIITAVPTALTHFSYLYKKPKADMHYALPLNNKQRFWADYLSGLSVYLVPVIAAIILSFSILGIGSMFIDTSMLWEEIIPIVFKAGIVVFLGMIQLYTVSVFSLTFCGNGFEAGFSIFAFNLLIPSTIVCLWLAVVETSTFGIVPISLLRMNIFTCTSPAGAAAFIFNFDDYINYGLYGFTSHFDASPFISMFAKWIIIDIICTAIYAAAAFLLYKSRKAEDVSKPYVHRSFFYALLTMAIFCVLSLFIIGEAPISAGIVVCAVGWFVMELITRRGFKKFWTAAVGFVVATAAVFGVIEICIASDGFGASRRVPSVSSIKSVTINTGSSYLITSANYTDEKVIEEVVKLHQECVDRYYNFDENDFPPVDRNDNICIAHDDFFSVTYTTKSGALISREYQVTQSMEAELIKAILLSEETAKLCTQNIGYEYKNNGTPYDSVVSATFVNDNQSVSLSASEMDKLCSDLEADMNDMTEEELVNGKVYCYLDNTMFVLESFDRTVADLKDFGFDFSKMSIQEDFTLMIDPVFASHNITSYGSRGEHIIEEYWDEIGYLSNVDNLCNFKNYFNGYIYDDDDAIAIDHNNPYISELRDNMTTHIIGEKPIAVISFMNYGQCYFLKNTEENRQLIENLMKYEIEDYDYNSSDEYYDDGFYYEELVDDYDY